MNIGFINQVGYIETQEKKILPIVYRVMDENLAYGYVPETRKSFFFDMNDLVSKPEIIYDENGKRID